MTRHPSLGFWLSRTNLYLLIALCLGACALQGTPPTDSPTTPASLIDPHATTETRALYRNLHSLQSNVLFGHQDTLAYGVEWVDIPGKSDVHSVTGAYPAVYGWELGNLELGDDTNLDGVPFHKMQQWIKEGFSRGGVITIGWHATNPVSGQSAWEVQPTTEHVIPGGSHHHQLKSHLDTVAEFLQGLTFQDARGNPQPIPVLFRPWHEHNGDWFWWSKSSTAEQDYIALWRFTVEYLRDEKGLHNLIYVFSPDRGRIDLENFEQDYLYGYPGDEYVDVFGLDNYRDMGHPSNPMSRPEQRSNLALSLQYTAQLAEQHNKLPTLSEGGLDGIDEPDFWTESLLAGLNANKHTRKIAYALVWRNANREKEQRDHFYAPFPGHPSADDFVRFYEHPLIMFEDTLPNMYR